MPAQVTGRPALPGTMSLAAALAALRDAPASPRSSAWQDCILNFQFFGFEIWKRCFLVSEIWIVSDFFRIAV
jgi:hypothetical protein